MTWSAVALYRFPFPSRPGFQRSAEPQLGAMLLVRAYRTPSTPGSVGIHSGVCLGSTPRNRDVIPGPERRRSAELPLGAIRNSRNAPSRGSALRFMESVFRDGTVARTLVRRTVPWVQVISFICGRNRERVFLRTKVRAPRVLPANVLNRYRTLVRVPGAVPAPALNAYSVSTPGRVDESSKSRRDG